MSLNSTTHNIVPIVIITHDDTGVIIHENDAFKHHYNTHNETTLSALFPDFIEILEIGKTADYHDIKNDLWLRINSINTHHNDQDTITLSITDITDLIGEIKAADRVNDMKSNFLATMSHEIRTPMQSIYGLLEVMNESTADQDFLKMIATAKNSASGLLEILDDVLDLAKVDAGKMELDNFEIPLRTLARGLLEGLEIKVRNKDVILIDDIQSDIPFVIMGDPKRLRQVILNLVGNSIKFTENGSVTLKITTPDFDSNYPDNPFTLRFEIIDTGIGMTQEVADRLFKAFAQADNSTTREYGGTGLGLSISKKLIELMGGTIGVNSQKGAGSTFWFEFPTHKASEDVVVELPDLDGLSVLSLEDHPKGAQEIVNSLRSMGADIISTPDGAEALSLIKKQPFDVAIFDYGIPGDKNGLQLLKIAAKERPFMGLIMYTVHENMQIHYDLKTMGATYLAKPASRLGLGQAVKNAAKQYNKIDSNAPRRVLVAEDTESVRDVLSRQFKIIGIEADFVNDGQKAIERFDTEKYGLIITDLHMPHLDGYGLVQYFREHENKNYQKTPIIAMTADVQLAHRQAYMAHGFDECLLKPVSMGQLKRLFIRWGLISKDSEQKTEQPSQVLESSALDKDMVIRQMGAFDDNAIEMLNMFIEMTTPVIATLEQAFTDGDTKVIKEIAHSLKGAARSACLPDLGNSCDALQTHIENNSNENNGNIDAAMKDKIVIEFQRAKAEISTLKIQ